jgi:hypothetical protein
MLSSVASSSAWSGSPPPGRMLIPMLLSSLSFRPVQMSCTVMRSRMCIQRSLACSTAPVKDETSWFIADCGNGSCRIRHTPAAMRDGLPLCRVRRCSGSDVREDRRR